MASVLILGIFVWTSIQLSQSAVFKCRDYEECKRGLNIAGDGVLCTGSNSCFNARSTITSTKYVKCEGYESCANPDIAASGNLFCGGGASCQNGVLNGAMIACQGSMSCAGNPSITASTLAYCGGYYSCVPKGTMTQTTFSAPTLNCYGSESCYGWSGTIEIENEVACGGYGSCRSTTIQPSVAGSRIAAIECSATWSCLGSDISNVNELQLYGNMAAASSNIKGASVIKAYGLQSLQYADVDSDGIATMDVELYGYNAGFYSDIICRSGSTCNVYCKGTGCTSANFRCLPGSTCTITPAGCLLDNSVDNVDGIKCPIVYDSLEAIKSKESLKIDDIEPSFDDDDIINALTIKECNELDSCNGQTLDNTYNQAGCYGESSCEEATANIPESVYCYGKTSCKKSIINTVGANYSAEIKCWGSKSCLSAKYDPSDKVNLQIVSCNGFKSCQKIRQNKAAATSYHKRMKCDGVSSCANMDYKMNATAGFLRCDGDRSCLGATLNMNKEIGCYGQASCQKAEIVRTGNGEVECYGGNSCVNAVIDAEKSVLIGGYGAALRATISGLSIMVSSHLGLSFGTIDSKDKNSFVTMYGHLSGYMATMICQSGQSCHLRCYGTACKDMNYVCLSDSCDLEPAMCKTSTDASINGNFCPNYMTSMPPKRDYKHDQVYQYIKHELKYEDKLYELIEDHASAKKINKYFAKSVRYQSLKQQDIDFRKEKATYTQIGIGICGILSIVGSLGYLGYMMISAKRGKCTNNDYEIIP